MGDAFDRLIKNLDKEVDRIAKDEARATRGKITTTWNLLRDEWAGRQPAEAREAARTAFGRLGITFSDDDELDEWVEGIVAGEDLDLRVNIKINRA